MCYLCEGRWWFQYILYIEIIIFLHISLGYDYMVYMVYTDPDVRCPKKTVKLNHSLTRSLLQWVVVVSFFTDRNYMWSRHIIMSSQIIPQINHNGPLTRYAKLRVTHAPGMPGTCSPHRLLRKPLVSDPGMHHVPWCMSGSLTRGGGENVPGACATRNFMCLARGPWPHHRPTYGPTKTFEELAS